ncbi:DUF1178 family protein [Roseibium aggregatum]|uniref:DUF1178 family protein n=1 Tax=Roseibium aggregatum TaxID=187304 RepID=A0A939EJM2_9HYPH|nr:DUF1178 family protein [Roseibium aggregatum]MBN9673941.1 DUF1178 family protein [Roseibium aggregatum]
MIRYTLVCDCAHTFEGWFRNSQDFETQCSRELVVCPGCGSTNVNKALMAPAVSTARKKADRGSDPKTEAGPVPAAPAASEGTNHAVAHRGVAQAAALLPDDVRQKEVLEALRLVRSHVLENSENVGTGFAEEARKIHYGEAEERSICGQTSLQDAQDLLEEGIPVLALPDLPEDKN